MTEAEYIQICTLSVAIAAQKILIGSDNAKLQQAQRLCREVSDEIFPTLDITDTEN